MSHSTWEKTKGYSKRGFDKAWNTLDKLGNPVNRLSNKIGAEAFWPTTLDKESDKAARILRSFCKDGFYDHITDEEVEEQLRRGVAKEDLNMPRGKQRVVKKIPMSVIKEAKGLAIFTTMRTGLWMSGSGGSGVLIGRIKETGEWSPPSGIMTHTVGLGFLVGVDIYDCVVVINTYEALESFKMFRCTLGGEVGAMAGPVGVGGVLDTEVHKRQAPIWTYIKGRGFYAGIEIAGTVIIERTDENAEFYGEKLSVNDILAGKVKRLPSSISTLLQTLKAAQGDADVQEDMLPPAGQTPGDMEVVEEKKFGIPDAEDPDPFGVRALEAEGVMIREAGTRRIPNIETFEFRPSLRSPARSTRSRWSVDSGKLFSWRHSAHSTASSVDRGTQTDEENFKRHGSSSFRSRESPHSSKRNNSLFVDSTFDDEPLSEPELPVRSSRTQTESHRKITVSDQTVIPTATTAISLTAPTSPTFTRAKLVTIPKRAPPPLPPRNPDRPASLLSPESPLSEAGKAGLLSPTSGYDEDVKSLQLTPSLQKEHSQNFVSTSKEHTAAVNEVIDEDDEVNQGKKVQDNEDKQSVTGAIGVVDTVETQDGATEMSKSVRSEEESEEKIEERKEEPVTGQKSEDDGNNDQEDSHPPSELLLPPDQKPLSQASADDDDEDEFKSPLEQPSPGMGPTNDFKSDQPNSS